MCIVSDKIKFCTCSSKSIDRLQTYWELFRFNSHKELYIVGIPKWPSEWSDDNFEANTSTLLKRLNDSDAFDFPTDFQEKDAFKIVIQSKDKNIEPYKYSFEYRKKKWHVKSFGVFDLMNHFDKDQFGKIKFAIIK